MTLTVIPLSQPELPTQSCAACGRHAAVGLTDLCHGCRERGVVACPGCGTYVLDLHDTPIGELCFTCLDASTCDRCGRVSDDLATVDFYDENRLRETGLVCGPCRGERG